MRINNLNELNKKDDIQYKARNMYFDYVEPNGQFDKKQEIYQIWSYSTIVGYYNKTTHYAIFTKHKYSRTTTKQITLQQTLNSATITLQQIITNNNK